MVKIGKVKVDLTVAVQAERNEITARTRTQPRTFSIKVTIELTVASAKGILEMAAKVGGKKVAKASFEYQTHAAWGVEDARNPEHQVYDED